jgi:hypothetical protein
MSEEMWIAAHDELIEEYMEEHQDATEEEAIEATAPLADDRMKDYYEGLGDYKYEQMKDRKMEEENK